MINDDDFFCFLGLAFLRKKGKYLWYIDILLHRVIGWNETINNITWYLNQTRFFKNIFTIKRFKYFHDSLNIVLISASGHEYFYAKCVKFP